MNRMVIGVDPGINGAVSSLLLDGSSAICLEASSVCIPVVKGGKKTVYDVKAIYEHLRTFRNAADIKNVIIFIEKTQPMFGKAVQASWGLGRCEGLMEMCAVALQCPYEFVQPKTWQKHFGISKSKGDTKVQSVATAKQLFPAITFETPRGRVLDGVADSLLIAEYGRRKLCGGV